MNVSANALFKRIAYAGARRRLSMAGGRQRIVVAVGGNALQRRGDKLSIENMERAAKKMAPAIAALAAQHEVVLTHGNGPQVGELALERSCATFDVLGAESQGQIGFILSKAFQEIGVDCAAVVSQTQVDPADPAFTNPMKFVGPVYGAKEADVLARGLDWTVKPDGEYFRRVVPSPRPLRLLQLGAVRALLEASYPLVIAAGGGGAPVASVFGKLVGVEAVVDKDLCGAMMARELDADGFLILTDGGGIWENFGKKNAREMASATPAYLDGVKAGQKFPGSMGPKVAAAVEFVRQSRKPGAWAAIGDLNDVGLILDNTAGTIIREQGEGGGEDVVWREAAGGGAEGGASGVVVDQDGDDDDGDADGDAEEQALRILSDLAAQKSEV